MNRTTSLALLLIGVLLFLGSCAPFGYLLYHETLTSPVESKALPVDGIANSLNFQASPNTLARFSIEADVITPSVQEDPESLDKQYIARFKFPFRYSIKDSKNNVIDAGERNMAWKDAGSISTSNATATSTGGTLTASSNLDKFTVPADGNISIDFELSEDITYAAKFSSPQLHLYDELIDNTWYIVAGVTMLLLGFLLSMVALVIFIIRSAQENTDTNPAGLANNESAVQDAMIIQLSALSGYIIPLGNFILPLVLWLIWKGKDEYTNKMGCEAVNFQLSIIIYYVLCVILFFVLIGFLLIFAVAIFHLAYIIIAAIRVSRGEEFRYPLTIRFFKPL